MTTLTTDKRTKHRTLGELEQLLQTKTELKNRGFSEHYILSAVRNGSAKTLRKGVYVAFQEWNTLNSWEQYAVEVMAVGRSSKRPIFSHQSAAILHNLWVIGQPPSKIHVCRTPNSKGASQGVSTHLYVNLDEIRCLTDAGLEATNLVQTLIDCAKTLPLLDAVALADSAVHSRKITYESLRNSLAGYNGRCQNRVQRVVNLMSAQAESPGETAVRLLLREMGIDFVEQLEIYAAGRLYRADFYLPEYNIIIEFDGVIKYSNFGPRDDVIQLERYREKELQNAGYIVFRTNWYKSVTNPRVFKRELSSLLNAIR